MLFIFLLFVLKNCTGGFANYKRKGYYNSSDTN